MKYSFNININSCLSKYCAVSINEGKGYPYITQNCSLSKAAVLMRCGVCEFIFRFILIMSTPPLIDQKDWIHFWPFPHTNASYGTQQRKEKTEASYFHSSVIKSRSYSTFYNCIHIFEKKCLYAIYFICVISNISWFFYDKHL